MLNLYLVNLVLKLLFDYLHGSGANPPSPHIVQNSRELSVKDTQHLRLTSACPFLTTPTALFSGGISSRAVPSPILGKDGEMGLNIREVLLMNFINSLFERMMNI